MSYNDAVCDVQLIVWQCCCCYIGNVVAVILAAGTNGLGRHRIELLQESNV